MATVESIHSKLILDTKEFTGNLRTAFSSANQYSTQFSNQGGRTVKGTFDEIVQSVRKTNEWTRSLNDSTNKYVTSSNNLKQVKQNVDSVNESISQTKITTDKTKSSLQSLGEVITAGAISAILISTGKDVLNTAGKFEKYNSILKNTFQSEVKAAQAMEMLKNFAATTPFSVDELTASFIKFVNRGLIPTQKELVAFGDIAASQGKSFDQFTEAVLDATSGEFERLKEFGITAKAIEGTDRAVLSFKGLNVEVQKTPEALKNVLIEFGKMKGVAGSMDAVSKTFEGAVSNFGDSADSLKTAIGEVFLEDMKGVVIAISEMMASTKEWIKENPKLAKTILVVTLGMAALTAIILAGSVAFNTLGLSALATNAKVLLFGTTLERTALMASASWLSILGPFALGAAVLTFTAVFITEHIEKKQKEREESDTNLNTIGALTELGKSQEAIKKSADKLNFAKAELDGYRQSVNATQADQTKLNNVIGTIGHRFPFLAEKLREANQAGKAIDKVFEDYTNTANKLWKEQEKVTDKTNKLANSNKGLKGVAKEVYNDILETAELLQYTFRDEVKIKASFQFQDSESALRDTQLLEKQFTDLGLGFKALGFTPEKGKQTLNFEINTNKSTDITKVKSELKKLETILKNLKYESTSILPRNQVQLFNNSMVDVVNSLAKADQTEKDMLANGMDKRFVIIAAGAERAKIAVQSVGGEYTKLLQAQAQLASVKLTNFTNQMNFLSSGISQYIDNQTNAQLSAIDIQVNAINEKNKAIEEMEREHQENMQSILDQYTLQRSAELDAEFNQRVELINIEFQTRLDGLLAATSSQEEQKIISDQIEADRVQTIDTLRGQYDQKLKTDTDTKRKEEEAKLKEEKKKNEENKKNDLLSLETLEARKEEITRRSELEKQRVKKISALIEWQAGKSAFEANKRAQVAGAVTAMAMTMLTALQAWAMLTAQGGFVGMGVGAGLLALLTGLSLAAGATAIGAAQSQQYPPPPIFMATGGIVPGIGNNDSVPAMLTPGEMVVDKNTTNQIKENINNIGGSINLTLYNNIYSNDPEEIASSVSEIIFDRIERRFQSV